MLSLAVHLLLLGTGFAFARFAGELFFPNRDPVMVTLIGKEGSSRRDGEQKKVGRVPPVPVQREKQRPLSAPEEPAQKQSGISEPRSVSAPNAAGRLVQEQPPAITSPERGNSTESGRTAGNQSGSVSSEQWAVIVSSIERVKSYPRLARERGIEGVVHLRFRLKPQGEVDRVEIVKSSGFDILDQASVTTVYRASPMPYVTGWIELPIAYVLK